MRETFHKNFHIIQEIDDGDADRQKIFILDTWRPSSDVWLIGCAIGLLCFKSDNFELYLSVSKNAALEPSGFFVGLKKDWLFYQQRDVYTSSTGINDLVSYHFLPEGTGFLIKKDEAIYIKVGVNNLTARQQTYDAFCNLYYTPA